MRTRHSNRRQGMSEYIGLVGLIAILMITGVWWYGRRVDEAIEGSTAAFNRGTSRMNGPLPPGASGMPTRTVTDPAGTRWDVHDTDAGPVVTPPGEAPHAGSPPYDPTTHGA